MSALTIHRIIEIVSNYSKYVSNYLKKQLFKKKLTSNFQLKQAYLFDALMYEVISHVWKITFQFM